MDYWDNPYFRSEIPREYAKEHGIRASDLIREAIAITLSIWLDALPPDGFHSFVDARHVPPKMCRGIPVYGWVFQKAGFSLHPERTKSRKLYRWVMPLDMMLSIKREL